MHSMYKWRSFNVTFLSKRSERLSKEKDADGACKQQAWLRVDDRFAFLSKWNMHVEHVMYGCICACDWAHSRTVVHDCYA